MTSVLLYALLMIPVFLLTVVVHEVSHGWVANRLGDPTAKMAGRLSLNPLKHIDPIGTVVLPLILIAIHSPFVFGWAKPVPINAMMLRRPKSDMLWVGLAGPASNFALATALAAFLRLTDFSTQTLFGQVIYVLIATNLILGIFNLIPIPPLDGSRMLVSLLPFSLARLVILLEPFGMILLFALIYLGLTERIVWPLAVRALHLLKVHGG